MMRACVVIPTYNEHLNIEKTLLELFKDVPKIKNYVIVDDSPNSETEKIVLKIAADQNDKSIHFIKNRYKMGRGYAVHLGLSWGIRNFSDCTHFIEMDGDGSHSAKMVLLLTSENPKSNFVVGSRYLSGSRIFEWPEKRQIFSRRINRTLRLLFNYELSDWTNGLRRYSKETAEVLTSTKIRSHGFIHLTEQILVLRQNSILAIEVPIDFYDRNQGTSSVTKSDLLNSAKDVIALYFRFQVKK
jgi:dolichol-phosphate mannosyltransferase